MCLQPINMPEIGPVKCRHCWQCKKERVNDLVGRAHAEMTQCDFSVCLTLTYGDTPSMAMGLLSPTDFQNFMKRLRKRGERDGFTVRYMVAGEYGKLKQRAHFHCILFFYGPAEAMPSFKYETLHWHFDQWEHGTTWADHPHDRSIRYIAKYLLKDGVDEQARRNQFLTGWIASSKVPLLGASHIEEEAELWVENGHAPKQPYFTVYGNKDKSGRATRYWMTATGKELFVTHFIEKWREKNPQKRLPMSDLLERKLDEEAAADPVLQWDRAIAHIKEKANPLWNGDVRPPAEKARITKDGRHVIAKDTIGAFYLREYDQWTVLEKERRLTSKAEIRAALEGRLEFKEQHLL